MFKIGRNKRKKARMPNSYPGAHDINTQNRYKKSRRRALHADAYNSEKLHPPSEVSSKTKETALLQCVYPIR